jgi:hypothetical protein
MLYYSIFSDQNLCIFHAGSELTRQEMLECYEDLMMDPRWPDVDTVLADLRDCEDVDARFGNDATRHRMEKNAFGNRRLIWLTGQTELLGKMTMAEIEGGSSMVERYQFQDEDELERYLGEDGRMLQECLATLR